MRFAATCRSANIAYDVLGAGAPLAMLHDFGESSGFWREFGYVEACLAHGRQVILVDLRGHGDSSKPTDPAAYNTISIGRDVIAVLNKAGIERADLLGYGLGGWIALCTASLAPERVHAVAAGGAHPFAEPMHSYRDALAKGLDLWVELREQGSGELTPATRSRLQANDPRALTAAVECDRPDMADAVVASGVPLLLFLGKDDPRYPLALSFAEESDAKVIGLAKHDHLTTAAAACAEILPRVLEFFDQPERSIPTERPPIGLWSGSWT